MQLIATKSQRFVDLTGQEYGRLTVVAYAGRRDSDGRPFWRCRCSCGKEKVAMAKLLLNGSLQSCGCLVREQASRNGSKSRGKFYRLPKKGTQFGRLAVQGYAYSRRGKQYVYCLCNCGNQVTVRTDCLTTGNTRSCGCLSSDTTSKRATTHGLSNTAAYTNAKAKERLERKRELDVEWTPQMESSLIALQPDCVLCGDTATSTDHVNALSLGYGLKPGNAVRLCQSCNSSKGPKPLDDLDLEDRTKLLKAASEFQAHWAARN
jgi:5-methylcytosine-specific restriction endonuclease McrA